MINATVKESVSLPMTALDETGVFCWNRIGVQGDRSCGRLVEVVHCHNCPIFSHAGRMLFDRAPPKKSSSNGLPKPPSVPIVPWNSLTRVYCFDWVRNG